MVYLRIETATTIFWGINVVVNFDRDEWINLIWLHKKSMYLARFILFKGQAW